MSRPSGGSRSLWVESQYPESWKDPDLILTLHSIHEDSDTKGRGGVATYSKSSGFLTTSQKIPIVRLLSWLHEKLASKRKKHLSVIFLGSKTSNRTCDADCEEAAVVSSELSKPCAEFCAFSKESTLFIIWRWPWPLLQPSDSANLL